MTNLSAFLWSIRWQDIIDIALVSYIIFRFYVLFKGTNAFRVFIGIAFLWLFHRIAGSLGLIVTSWAIQGIMAVAALIIIVVFRNEIRSVLQAKNVKTLLWGFPWDTPDIPLDAIVEGVFELARLRIGGLIVFPGKEDLSEAVHSGIPWGGSVSKEMIVSIFWHDNPVHDGAALVRGGRVDEVGVVLPLSHRKDFPSSYGTRHRAAAGLAESTDALVVVVSEERGEVSVAKGALMNTIREKKDLMRALEEHAGFPSRQRGGLRRQRLELGLAALVSVFFITGVWLSFARGLDTLITLESAVEYMNRDPGMEIADTSVNAVRLHLSGSGPLIKSLGSEQVKVRLDLSTAVAGSNTFSIAQKNISLPPGVLLKKVEPSTVEVTLDHLRKKGLPVQVDWVGKLPDSLILTEARLEPAEIELVGGKKTLEAFSTIYTEKVSLGGIQKSGTMTVKVALNPASLRIAPGSKDKVTVVYVVGQRMQ